MTPEKYCIIGAGASGLAVAKNFTARGIPYDCIDRASDLGGLWNANTVSGVVYESTHLVSAKTSTDFDDFKMPEEDFPAYPSHSVVLDYFRQFAGQFGVTPHLQFNKDVERITPRNDGGWDVKIKGEGAPRAYKGVVLANGHHNEPRMPAYPGAFAGEVMHSREYKSVRQLRDKRILVVGAGNSACDIIRDAVHGSGAKVVMSMRRGTWFVPKYMLGFPTHDVVSFVESIPQPRFLKRWIFQASLWVLQGPPQRYGLPKPECALDAAHPTMSDDIPRLASHGRLIVKPEIARYDGKNVVFTDGTSEIVDLIVFATGYKITFPFLPEGTAFDAHGRNRFYLNTAHEQYDTLFAAGLIQANGSIWRLADYQGAVIANAIVAAAKEPRVWAAFKALCASGDGGMPKGAFVASDRHKLEANYTDYRRVLRRQIRKFGAVRKMTLGPVTRPGDLGEKPVYRQSQPEMAAASRQTAA
jgi:Flavin-binding monooxygenase-like